MKELTAKQQDKLNRLRGQFNRLAAEFAALVEELGINEKSQAPKAKPEDKYRKFKP